MVDRNVLAAKLAELKDRMRRIRQHCPESSAELAEDQDAFDLVSFNLLLAVQSCLDLASHIIADHGWTAASTLAGSFRRLHENDVITLATAEALIRAVGLRNVVAHGYSGAEPDLIHLAATAGLADLERFSDEVGAWALRQQQ